MGLLKPASNQTAYLKVGLQGFEGSGKTHLACEFAMGLAKRSKKAKVAFFDTEKGSDFWVERMRAQGIELFVVRSRSFMDLLTTIREAEAEKYDFLIIDSITHVWRELQNAYLKKTRKDRISMPGWVLLKTEWAQFTDLYVNSRLHIAMCGRAGYEYDNGEGEDGKMEVVKVGTKMRAEGETGFEPDLLIETYKVPVSDTLSDRKAKKSAKGFFNRCVVIKDRADLVNGKVFDRPTFKDFKPVVDSLKLGGEHAQISKADSQQLFESGSDHSWAEAQRRKEIALEDYAAALIKKGLDGSSAEAKKARVELNEEIFGTPSKTAIESLPLEVLMLGIKRMKIKLGLLAGPLPPEEIPFG